MNTINSSSFNSAIQGHPTIIIFGHKNPDFDCLGSIFGLQKYLKQKYPDKKVIVAKDKNWSEYDEHNGLFDFSQSTSLNKSLCQDALAIVLDVGNIDRVNNSSYKMCKSIMNIDHHPTNKFQPKYNYINPKSAATSEALFDLIDTKDITQDSAKDFLIALLGDTGNLSYNSVTQNTKKVFNNLHQIIEDNNFTTSLWNKMISLTPQEQDLKKEIYKNMKDYPCNNNTKTLSVVKVPFKYSLEKNLPNGVLHNTINLLRSQNGSSDICIGAVFYPNEMLWHISIRSKIKEIPVNDLKDKFPFVSQGGHISASGGTMVDEQFKESWQKIIEYFQDKLNSQAIKQER